MKQIRIENESYTHAPRLKIISLQSIFVVLIKYFWLQPAFFGASPIRLSNILVGHVYGLQNNQILILVTKLFVANLPPNFHKYQQVLTSKKINVINVCSIRTIYYLFAGCLTCNKIK